MIEGVFINLDRSPERRGAMEAQLARKLAPYEVRRFPAIDGSRLTDVPQGMRPTQYGCWMSQLTVLREHMDNPHHLHLMEDDVLIGPQLLGLAEIVEVLDAGSRGGWDILYLDATLPEIADMALTFEWAQLAREKGTVHLHRVPPEFTVYGGHSYVVNGARKRWFHDFMSARLKAGKPFDDVLAWSIQHGELAAHLTSPFLTSSLEHGLERTLGASDDDRFLAWYLHRHLCFGQQLTPESLDALERRLAALAGKSGRAERILGELMAYRLWRWPRQRFGPEVKL